MTVDPNCAQMSNSLRRQSRLSVHRQSWWTSATVSSLSHSTTKFISKPKLSTSSLSKLLRNDQRSQHTMSTSQPHVRKEQSHLKLAHVISSCDETSIRVFFHDYLYFFNSVIFVVVIFFFLTSNTHHIGLINRFYTFIALQKLDEALDVLRYLNGQ